MTQLKESSVFQNLKHFVENRLRTEIELEKLRTRLATKDADYLKIFRLLSDSDSHVAKSDFIRKAKGLAVSEAEADFFFEYLDQAPRDELVTFAEFIREFAPSATSLSL